MQAKKKLSIEIDADLKGRFEKACDRNYRKMSPQIVSLIQEWTEAQEAPLTVPLSPQVLLWLMDYCKRQKMSPEMWVSLQIQQARSRERH